MKGHCLKKQASVKETNQPTSQNQPTKQTIETKLGGVFNPFEKYARQIGSFPQGSV